MINQIVVKRLKAFAIDYAIILIYIGLLIASTLLISQVFKLDFDNVNSATSQVIGFTTLTLPVILYFTFMENGKYAGTIGKKKFGIRVVSNSSAKATAGQLLLRNCIKFLPWEFAHFFIYRLYYYTSIEQSTPNWVFTGLIVSQVLALIFMFCILFTKSSRSVYEIFSRTMVINSNA